MYVLLHAHGQRATYEVTHSLGLRTESECCLHGFLGVDHSTLFHGKLNAALVTGSPESFPVGRPPRRRRSPFSTPLHFRI